METSPAGDASPPTAARVRPRRDSPRTPWIRRILLIAVLAVAGVSIVRSLNDKVIVHESIWVREDPTAPARWVSDIADAQGKPLEGLHLMWVGRRVDETQGRRDVGIDNWRGWNAVYRGPSGDAVELPLGRYYRFDLVR